MIEKFNDSAKSVLQSWAKLKERNIKPIVVEFEDKTKFLDFNEYEVELKIEKNIKYF